MSRPQRPTFRANYRILNGGYDDEAPIEDRIDPQLGAPPPPPQTGEASQPEVIASIAPQLVLLQPYPEDTFSGQSPLASSSQPTYKDPPLIFTVADGGDDNAGEGPSNTHLSNSPLESIVYPNESVSQAALYSKRARAQSTSWVWRTFECSVTGTTFIDTRSKRPRIEKTISCIFPGCNYSLLESKRNNSTSRLASHLLKHGVTEENPTGTRSQQTIMSYIAKGKATTVSRPADLQMRLKENLVRWIVQTMQPFSVVESISFQQIFHELPGIELPITSGTSLKRLIEKDFDTTRHQLKNDLAQTCESISLSLDVWTSSNHLSILAIIGHWLTEDFEYRERLIEFKEIIGPHTGENMAEIVEDTLVELGIEGKLLTITADNATNNETLCTFLESNLSSRLQQRHAEIGGLSQRLRFQGTQSLVRCLAHILNLIVKQLLSGLRAQDSESADSICVSIAGDDGEGYTLPDEYANLSALARLRVFVLYISRSPQRRQLWKQACASFGGSAKVIDYDVDTRWNSLYRMINQALQAKHQISAFNDIDNTIPRFSTRDWTRLGHISRVLEKFDLFTRTLSQREPQISLSLTIYYEISDTLQEIADKESTYSDLDDDFASAARGAMKKYNRYLRDMDRSNVYYTAAIINPRFKTSILHYELKEEAEDLISILKDWMISEYPRQQTPEPESVSNIATRGRFEARFMEKLRAPRPEPISDIERYFREPIVQLTQDIDDSVKWILNWWKMNRFEYPIMARIARDYLAIPASEVAVERTFSLGRDLLSVRRQRLNGNSMRKLMLLRDIYLQRLPDEVSSLLPISISPPILMVVAIIPSNIIGMIEIRNASLDLCNNICRPARNLSCQLLEAIREGWIRSFL